MVLVKKYLRTNGVSKSCVLCLQFLELLGFWKGFKAFLSQIFDLFSMAKGVLFIGKDFVVLERSSSANIIR